MNMHVFWHSYYTYTRVVTTSALSRAFIASLGIAAARHPKPDKMATCQREGRYDGASVSLEGAPSRDTVIRTQEVIFSCSWLYSKSDLTETTTKAPLSLHPPQTARPSSSALVRGLCPLLNFASAV
jgi:hypothetical protein